MIWAHAGVGRVVHPVPDHLAMLERAIQGTRSLYFDLSWDETAKYITRSAETLDATAALLNRHPDRFLFGSDEVAPTKQATAPFTRGLAYSSGGTLPSETPSVSRTAKPDGASTTP